MKQFPRLVLIAALVIVAGAEASGQQFRDVRTEPAGSVAQSHPPTAVAALTWSDTAATGAATGYCLAKHPYQTVHVGSFTPDGFEVVSAPGLVGAIRRNFVADRTLTTGDQGSRQTCPQACAQFGKAYEPRYVGVALRQQIRGGRLINSGIGDIGASAMPDHDFYLGRSVIAGQWSRGNSWHESDVAQADYCCCQVK